MLHDEANTVDLRGYEQVCNRKEAEEYAAFRGYTMVIFGESDTPYDIDPDGYKHEGFKNNRLLDEETRSKLKGKMDCRNCDGSGLFYQMDDCVCNCTGSEA